VYGSNHCRFQRRITVEFNGEHRRLGFGSAYGLLEVHYRIQLTVGFSGVSQQGSADGISQVWVTVKSNGGSL
jgi:hypothetical protein